MSMTVEQLREEISLLPLEKRRQLFESEDIIHPPTTPEEEALAAANDGLHPACLEEVEFRTAEYRAGRMGAVSLDEFLRELDEEDAAA